MYIFCYYLHSELLYTFNFDCSSNVTTTFESLTKRHVIIKFSNTFVLIKYSHAQIFPFRSSKFYFCQNDNNNENEFHLKVFHVNSNKDRPDIKLKIFHFALNAISCKHNGKLMFDSSLKR